MRILVIGGGGREHALVWKLAQSPSNPKIFCAPGNAGIGQIAECVDISATDIDALLEFALKNEIALSVVGPEAPLCAGIVDAFLARGLKIFGPSAAAAELEGNKAWCKEIMAKHNLPTAAHRCFSEPEAALAYIAEAVDYPMVIKASGLAAGKGVVIATTEAEAEQAIQEMMVDERFGAAGNQVVIEEFLVGEEASIMALTDGETICVLESSQDHKRAFDGDQGPNTGGMGAYSPAPVVTAGTQSIIERDVLVPIVHAMKQERRSFSGVLYAGLMMTAKGPKVLEFNVRFGDPECQVLMARLDCDLVEVLNLCVEGRLDEAQISWDKRPALCVIMAQEGYPGPVKKEGGPIYDLDKSAAQEDVVVFHSATRYDRADLLATGGRVLGVTALGADIKQAQERAYTAVDAMTFPGSFHRRDIGNRAL